MATCSAENCNETSYAKGYCRPHWHRLRTYGRLNKITGLIKGNCIIDDCDKKIKAHGYCVNHYFILKIYNIKPEEYNEKLKLQNYVCAICEKPETSIHNKTNKIKNLSVDHDHETGKVRELLCQRCNHFLGRVDESTDLLNKMIEYIKKHKGN